MDSVELIFAGLDFVMREVALFAAVGFLVLGVSDLAVDLVWIARTLRRRFTDYRRFDAATADTLPPPEAPGLLAIFIPAWDESTVIGRMMAHALATFSGAGYRIYIGCYPNDPATIAAVRQVDDGRVRLVIGPAPGPTTKADCLNNIWRAMREDERAGGATIKAVVLHDAEDVVHSAELGIFDRLIERFDLVQLPVLPLIDPNSRWIAGHYADEFAESHGKELVVREALGASLPSAGVGCAFARAALDEIADLSGGAPFEAESLTEDYELGLKLHALGRRAAFVRVPGGRKLVVTQEFFPGTIGAAVSQKARWMTGIALSGWDRLGWSGGLAERWMRLRDRQSVLAAVVLFAGYVGLILWALLNLAHMALGLRPEPVAGVLALLLSVNVLLLVWRLAMRFGFVAKAYGWREGLRSIPRVVTGNAIAMLAARRAVIGYLRTRKSGSARWDKTAHAFPSVLPAE